jgi:hypothetical protein
LLFITALALYFKAYGHLERGLETAMNMINKKNIQEADDSKAKFN